ncbi:hypothetical protein OIU79_003417 [Salix purpurea]|uniref:Uncharacterized protein n=1 Tax=Salix purpurea TaxID=77065 RepID=A0A9Q0ZFA4_SALPP|nr:hypothetical protein OIU79_003417 [Salix purpurea]
MLVIQALCVESEQGRPDRSLLEVIGDGVGGVRPANFQRQKLGYAKLGSQPEGMDDTMQDGSDQQNEQLLPPPGSPSTHRVRPSSQSAKVTVGTMDTESSTNTRSNPSQGNAASSRRSKTAEWALLVTSVVLEAISAIFEQLGYPLTSMVMAFVALLLSILDLILKARQRGDYM